MELCQQTYLIGLWLVWGAQLVFRGKKRRDSASIEVWKPCDITEVKARLASCSPWKCVINKMKVGRNNGILSLGAVANLKCQRAFRTVVHLHGAWNKKTGKIHGVTDKLATCCNIRIMFLKIFECGNTPRTELSIGEWPVRFRSKMSVSGTMCKLLQENNLLKRGGDVMPTHLIFLKENLTWVGNLILTWWQPTLITSYFLTGWGVLGDFHPTLQKARVCN